MTVPDVRSLVAYTADPWESVLPALRYRAPAQIIGIEVIQGNQGPDVDLSPIPEADLVLVQRDFPRFAGPFADLLQNAWQYRKPIVYEIDDLLFALPENHVAHHDLSAMLFPMLWGLQSADLVTVSTPALAQALAPFNPHTRLLPNYLDDRLWSFRRPAPAENASDQVVIGYMGGGTHATDLALVAPILHSLLDRFPDRLLLHFWGGEPPAQLRDLPQVRWTPLDLLDYAGFARFFSDQTCDIAIAPLEDTPFNQAKSAIKFLEYSALGFPGVYSQVAPYQAVIQTGIIGFHAATPADWEAHLLALIENPDLRFSVATAAQDTIRQDWLLSQHAGAWQAAYQEATVLAAQPDNAHQARFPLLARAASQALQRQLSIEQELADSKALAELLRRQLDEIMNSRSWQALQKLQSMRTRLIPIESRREKLLQNLRLLSRRP